MIIVPERITRASHGSTRALVAFAIALLLAPLITRDARGQDTTHAVRIGLTYQPGTKPGVIVLAIRGAWGDSLQAIIARDLDYGDRVEVIGLPGTPAASSLAGIGPGVSYPLWKSLNAAAAVQTTVTPSGLHVAVHDVTGRKIVQVADFPLPLAGGSGEWRLAVHGISDEIEQWITGTRGVAQTRILFVRGGRVYVVDTDGFGERLVSDAGLSLSPAWAPDGLTISYSVLGSRGWSIVTRSVAGGAGRTLPSTTSGLNTTPAFSPNGLTLAYSHGDEAGTDLMLVDLAGGGPRRITVGHGSDNTSPEFSPDGRKIAFTSGRAGHPEVYIMDVDGSNVELLTPFNFGDRNYRSNPDWAPDAQHVAFQSQIGGAFQIMVISLRDRSVKQITSEGVNEDPAWAPDARHVVFTSSRTGVRQLFILDSESGRARQLTHAGGARLAAWSHSLGHAR
ncbi:MAG: PD40 domain-containing protein [Gemmatimonadaceae bacterium]|nr:PD40 domain-containing protein [Gemmatimonadaceae bacterium]